MFSFYIQSHYAGLCAPFGDNNHKMLFTQVIYEIDCYLQGNTAGILHRQNTNRFIYFNRFKFFCEVVITSIMLFCHKIRFVFKFLCRNIPKLEHMFLSYTKLVVYEHCSFWGQNCNIVRLTERHLKLCAKTRLPQL